MSKTVLWHCLIKAHFSRKSIDLRDVAERLLRHPAAARLPLGACLRSAAQRRPHHEEHQRSQQR
jgi:hypothetical protein